MINFYLVQLLAFIAGVLLILLIRRRYSKITKVEFIAVIILYALLVLLFTEPVIDGIKKFWA